MRKLLLTIVVLVFSVLSLQAQSRVTVSQKGSGNTIHINQGSAKRSGKSGGKNDDCRSLKNIKPDKNTISVRYHDDNGDTLAKKSDSSINIFTKILPQGRLSAHQRGSDNGLYMIMPDSQYDYHNFYSTQEGNKNLISARLNKNIKSTTLSQNGDNNSLTVNPCKSKSKEARPSKNNLSVSQTGKSNTVSIRQH